MLGAFWVGVLHQVWVGYELVRSFAEWNGNRVLDGAGFALSAGQAG